MAKKPIKLKPKPSELRNVGATVQPQPPFDSISIYADIFQIHYEKQDEEIEITNFDTMRPDTLKLHKDKLQCLINNLCAFKELIKDMK